jgi:hypothetical protein
MKMNKWFMLIGLVLIASIAFMGCDPADSGAGGTPPEEPVDPEDPPVIVPVPPTFEEVVIGKSWQVLGIERYQDTRPPARTGGSPPEPEVSPFDTDICWFWGDEEIIAYVDLNDDGFMSPGEDIATVPYTLNAMTIVIDGRTFTVDSFGANSWSMITYLDGFTNPEWLGEENKEWTGWARIHYIPCTYPWLDEEISFNFAFVFDDMGDTTAAWDFWWKFCRGRLKTGYDLEIDFDFADAFYFTSGTPLTSYIEDDPVVGNHIVIIDFHDPFTWAGTGDIDSLIVVYTEAYGMLVFESYKELKPDHVYDMYVEVTAADNATFQFVSRVDGSGFTKSAILDFSEMGELIIRMVDDADLPIVNP